MKIGEELAGARRSEAARGRPGRGRGAPWAGGRPQRGARRLPPTLCPCPAAPTASDGGGHSCFHPAGERRVEKASPRWPGSQAAAVLAQGRGAEPPPRSARRTSPFLPLGRLYATTSRPRPSAATRRHPRSLGAWRSPDAPRSGKAAGGPAPRYRTPPPRRRSPRVGGPLARPAAAAPLTCIDAMMKPSPQGQRGLRRRGRSRRARVTPRGPNIPGTGAESPMGRGPRV